jgi:hypothetical protein
MRIIGCPLKIFCNNRVYIPTEYLHYYGISEKLDKILISEKERSLFYCSLSQSEEKYSKKETISLRGGLITLPAAWVRQNGLAPGDTVFMLGMSDGLLVYVQK